MSDEPRVDFDYRTGEPLEPTMADFARAWLQTPLPRTPNWLRAEFDRASARIAELPPRARPVVAAPYKVPGSTVSP